MDAREQVRADEVVRSLAAAAAAVRLYPPTSEIPSQAVARFVSVATIVTSRSGPVRFVVEPKTFKWADEPVGEGQAHVVAFAEALYAHQVGQLIVAPEIDSAETLAFVRCVASDPAATREEGGLRAVAVASGVNHIAVIELTLRASTENGLAGLDLTSAPLDVIGPAVVKSAADWARSASSGSGDDEVADVIGSLEAATQELATERVAQALLQLDEKTRAAVLAAAVRPDGAGKTMEGMLSVIAQMRPATLARLLTLAAARTGSDPHSMLSKLELPPEALRALTLMLRDSPRTEGESGVPGAVDVTAMATEATSDTEADEIAVRQAVASADRYAAATRALSTSLMLVQRSPDAETFAALSDAAVKGLSAGAFTLVHEALRAFDEASDQPGLDPVLTHARQQIAARDTLAEGLSHLSEPLQATDAAAVISAAGAPGADALLDAWATSSEDRRRVILETARLAPEHIIASAGRRLRNAGPAEARSLLRLVSQIQDRRAVGVLAQALDSESPEVRAIAIDGLAALGSDDAWSSVASSLTHPDEATALIALATMRDARRRQAIPAMLAVLRLKASGTRNHKLKREIIGAIGTMGATEAEPDLRVLASRRFAFGRKARELRDAARRAIADLGQPGSGDQGGAHA